MELKVGEEKYNFVGLSLGIAGSELVMTGAMGGLVQIISGPGCLLFDVHPLAREQGGYSRTHQE